MLIFIILLILFYFLPSIIAFNKRKRNKGAIFALNFFLGFTVVGWVISLVWALTQDGLVVVSKDK
ncbi:MAG: superinfection immunity protein [Candidatus Paceibacterota bacterium]